MGANSRVGMTGRILGTRVPRRAKGRNLQACVTNTQFLHGDISGVCCRLLVTRSLQGHASTARLEIHGIPFEAVQAEIRACKVPRACTAMFIYSRCTPRIERPNRSVFGDCGLHVRVYRGFGNHSNNGSSSRTRYMYASACRIHM
jgi:hypothetical protein